MEILRVIFGAPLASLFIVAGLVFLFIAVVGNISGKIQPGKVGRIVSGVIGFSLLVMGLIRSGGELPSQSLVPSGETEGPIALFHDNFEDGQADSWVLDPGWQVERDGSNYVLSGVGHTWATLQDQAWDDYRVRFRLKLGQGTIHLIYRLREGPIRYFIGFHQEGLYLSKQMHNEFIDLTAVLVSHSLDHWHEVEIVGWGGRIQVYVDGELELDYFDEHPLHQGTIAFETLDDSYAQIDDILVMPPGHEPPPPVF